ncbi:hypothetical protein H8D64_02175 [PVC group bacterium]|nr:hypothetical protein [PVC group bacterium]
MRTGFVLVLMSVVFFAGCGKKGEDDASGVQQGGIDALMANLAEIRSEGGHDQAVEFLNGAMKSSVYEPIKGQVVSVLLNEYIDNGELDKAKERFIKEVQEDQSLAGTGFEVIMRACAETGTVVAVEWCDHLLQSKLADDIKMYAWQGLVRVYAETGALGEMLPRMDAVFTISDDAKKQAVLRWIMGAVIQKRNFKLLDKFVEATELRAENDPEIGKLVVIVRLDALLFGGKYDEAGQYLFEMAGSIDDRSLSSRLNWLLDNLKNDIAKADALAERAINELDENTLARETAASRWLGMANNDLDLFAVRASRLLDLNLGVSRMASAYKNYFYKVQKAGSDEQKKTCTELCVRLESLSSLSDADRKSLVLLRLDGAFYREDFESALELIKSGVPGYDEDWHSEMENKVSAHLALQQGRKQEAIDLFTKHMEKVEAWKTAVVNPENGQRMIKEAVLGFNEKRVGDVFASMEGKATEAEAAYGRATAWYKEALQILKPDSPEYKNAENELKQVPEIY